MNEKLHRNLKDLRLSGMISSLDVRLQEARGNQLDYGEFLELLIYDELAVRQERKIDRMLKKAAFNNLKTLEHFNWQFNPNLERNRFYELASCKFIRDAQDILFIDPPGTGNYKKLYITEKLTLPRRSEGHFFRFSRELRYRPIAATATKLKPYITVF